MSAFERKADIKCTPHFVNHGCNRLADALAIAFRAFEQPAQSGLRSWSWALRH